MDPLENKGGWDCYRSCVDSDKQIIEEEKFLIEVAHQLYDKREFKLN